MIELNIDGGVATVTLNRPPANAFSREGLLQLRDTIEELQTNPAVRALVITGSGPKFFSAGADLNTFASGDKAVALDMISAFGLAFEALAETHLVTVAAINGFAMGGGLECALACDIRIAEEHAQMALPESTVGLLPGGTGTQTLPWLVGEGWAKRMILTGERVDAATALRIGLVEEVVPQGEALAKAQAIAQRVGKQSPDSVRACKALVHQAREGVPRGAALAAEREAFIRLFDGSNQREGVNAFLEKRSAKWQ
jgi:enoyl-CoA hydratase/carnithine racemase